MLHSGRRNFHISTVLVSVKLGSLFQTGDSQPNARGYFGLLGGIWGACENFRIFITSFKYLIL
jgi:hypothetical protein